jgi:hypothetical protein
MPFPFNGWAAIREPPKLGNPVWHKVVSATTLCDEYLFAGHLRETLPEETRYAICVKCFRASRATG